ncbi:hypothetical protein ABZ897_50435 [Nonomuraea sp. NPDC046802]|uniref:hypothetical protein n=1 Tax=Nonomuraea sp. NPDC046802 TaxID=3154919 RepID=UPI0033D92904
MGESRHTLARRVFFGNLGRLVRGYECGMEDRVGALGLGSCAIRTPALMRRREAYG